MPRAGPRKVGRYTDEFKLTAFRLSQQPGIQVQTVAAALEIHPFMLSKWRKQRVEALRPFRRHSRMVHRTRATPDRNIVAHGSLGASRASGGRDVGLCCPTVSARAR
jgi:transposase-like protein